MNKKSNNVKPPGIDIKENLIQKKITIGWLDLKTKLYLPLFFRLFTLLIGGLTGCAEYRLTVRAPRARLPLGAALEEAIFRYSGLEKGSN